MNKITRIAVWAFLISIITSGIAITSRAFGAEDYKTLSREYNCVYEGFLIKKIKTFRLGDHVVLYFKDGREIGGVYENYDKYDETIWIKEDGHWLQDAYGVNELFDVSINLKRPV